ncbi:MAG TPA: putative DNA-binding protein [Firmicutes bacterium]|nr:putative DNA-binding protein [Bacillota bacterium]
MLNRGIVMEDTLRKNLIYDFYGPLLTERQRDIYQMYYAQDMSLGEIAEQLEISRQAVYDMIKRSAAILEDYESKLGLLSKFQRQQAYLDQIEEHLDRLQKQAAAGRSDGQLEIMGEIQQLINKIRAEA